MSGQEPARIGFRYSTMIKFFRPLLFWSLLLWACSPGGLSTETIPASTTEVSSAGINPSPAGVSTAASSSPQGCAYQWAYHGLPELSNNFLRSIQLLQPEAQGNAFAFGENCVYADGSSTFLPMETDFNVTLQVSDLSNESELGEWIVNVMQIIENIPADQIIGPRPGRVSMQFQSDGEQKFVNFYIDQYRALSAGLSSAEIYQAFQIP